MDSAKAISMDIVAHLDSAITQARRADAIEQEAVHQKEQEMVLSRTTTSLCWPYISQRTPRLDSLRVSSFYAPMHDVAPSAVSIDDAIDAIS